MGTAISRRRRTRQAPDVRRAQVLDAAGRVFLERGLAGTTMDDVAQAAGVAKGTVYLYFASKDALVEALGAGLVERVVTRAQRLPDVRPGAFAAQLDRFVSGVVDDMLDYPDLQHLVFHDVPRHGALDEVYGPIASFVAGGLPCGEFRVSDPGVATWFLVEGLHGVLAQAAHEPRPGKRTVREGVVEAARRLLHVTDLASVSDEMT